MTDLRPELLPPHVDETLLKQVETLIDIVAEPSKPMPEREKALADLNELLKPESPIEFSHLQEYWGSMDLEEFALIYARKIPIVDISYEELRAIIEKFFRAEEADFYIPLLEKNFSFPSISALIYWPNELHRMGEEFDFGFEIGTNEPTTEEITDIIWEYEKTRDVSRFKRHKT